MRTCFGEIKGATTYLHTYILRFEEASSKYKLPILRYTKTIIGEEKSKQTNYLPYSMTEIKWTEE